MKDSLSSFPPYPTVPSFLHCFRRIFSALPRPFVGGVAFCLALALAGCNSSGQGNEEKKPVPIRVAVATKSDVPRVLDAVGNVEANTSVDVKSQVGGQIVEVPVVPGQEVSENEVLFRLDPRPFDAAVAEARARLARDRALLAKARQDLARYTTLLKQDVISREAYDQMATAAKTAGAVIEEDEAALQAAELNREYSVIRAPIAGKLGDILVRLGNVIKANDDRTLVVINSIRPAEVRFTVAERHLPLILQRMKEGPLPVSVLPEGDRGEPVTGLVTALDNAVDRTTGSIRLHAMFENADNRLWPGQFVRVSLVMATLENAVLVPERAVLEGLSGQYVYLAKANGTLYTVEPRNVTVEKGEAGKVVVSSGVAAGDIVVIDGQLGLAPGALAKDAGEVK